MTKSNGIRDQYTPQDEALIKRCRAKNMTWREIQEKHFPDRSVPSLKTKWSHMRGMRDPNRPKCPPGRPPKTSTRHEKTTIGSDEFKLMSIRGSQALGDAVDALFWMRPAGQSVDA